MTEFQQQPQRVGHTITPQIDEATGVHTGFSVSTNDHFATPVHLQEYQPDHLNSMQTPDDMIAESLGQLYPNLEAVMHQFVPQLDEDEKQRFATAIETNDWDFLTPKFEEWFNNYDPSLDQQEQTQTTEWDVETAANYWASEKEPLDSTEPQGMEIANELMDEASQALSSGYPIHADLLSAAAMFSAGNKANLREALNEVIIKHGSVAIQAYHQLFGE